MNFVAFLHVLIMGFWLVLDQQSLRAGLPGVEHRRCFPEKQLPSGFESQNLTNSVGAIGRYERGSWHRY